MIRPVALYIHVPFCRRMCPYCDFNAYAGLGHLTAAYVDALLQELRNWAPLLDGCVVPTISFGGGTPSLLAPDQVDRILRTSRQSFQVAATAEITLEANPGTVSAPSLAGYRAAGVNRLSLGVQSFQADELAWLGRDHHIREVYDAMDAARSAGFPSVNLDLIFGLPGRAQETWEQNLRAALDLGPDHLSLYALTVEEGTPLGRRVAAGREPAPDPDAAADQYALAETLLETAGFHHYEISNWAVPGHECRHNLTYWRNDEYLGVGPGAHSYFSGHRFSVVRSPREYIDRLSREDVQTLRLPLSPVAQFPLASPLAEVEEVDPVTDFFDTLSQGLRLVDGVELAAVARRHGEALLGRVRPEFRELAALGLLEEAAGRLRLTARGRLLANEVLVRLLRALEQSSAIHS